MYILLCFRFCFSSTKAVCRRTPCMEGYFFTPSSFLMVSARRHYVCAVRHRFCFVVAVERVSVSCGDEDGTVSATIVSRQSTTVTRRGASRPVKSAPLSRCAGQNNIPDICENVAELLFPSFVGVGGVSHEIF